MQTNPYFSLLLHSLKQSVHPHSVNHVSVNIRLVSLSLSSSSSLQVRSHPPLLNTGLLLLLTQANAMQSENIHNCFLSGCHTYLSNMCKSKRKSWMSYMLMCCLEKQCTMCIHEQLYKYVCSRAIVHTCVQELLHNCTMSLPR